MRLLDNLETHVSAGVAELHFDPKLPITRTPARLGNGAVAPGQNQRDRRAVILATIRRLLIEDGFDGVTVRRVAEASGHAVQTIYNLVGPRDLAITEAINEYSHFVSMPSLPDPDDPTGSVSMLDRELASIAANPEFCRNVCLIFFTEARSIFYDFRARQTKAMHSFLSQQQRGGIIRPEIDTRTLAEQLIITLSALCVEWSDRPFAYDVLRQRLYAAYSMLMNGVLSPNYNRIHLTGQPGECASH